jgi:hypothetical protein
MNKLKILKNWVQFVLLFALMSLLLLACSQKNFLISLDNQKQIDKRLVGIWVGNEKDNQIEGMYKEWKMYRNSDGSFSIDFKATLNGRVQESTEKGNWWVENGYFFEYHNISGKTDVYIYTVLNKKQVKFKATNLEIPHFNMDYEFIDTKVKK